MADRKTPAQQEAEVLEQHRKPTPGAIVNVPPDSTANGTPQSPAKPADRAKASKAELLSIAAILRVLEKLPDPQARGRVLKYVVDLEGAGE